MLSLGFSAAPSKCTQMTSVELLQTVLEIWGPEISARGVAKENVKQVYAALLALRWERLINAVTSKVRTSSGLMASPCLPACCNAEA